MAFAFLESYPQSGYKPRHIRPHAGFRGGHVYVTDGTLAFDAQGYISEADLLAQHFSAYRAQTSDWDADLLDIEAPLAEFCAATNHRAPWDFPHDVWARAHGYLRRFSAP